ncbi:hypothetical protein [Amycolatopsis sp. Hca4]|uniref:hypothetical protein n=1 Tax=Amycolatopsis sp. Hca4 TaxID=2742131 RepID=UPI00158F9F51|nr:hypothetical protein [Amycolatopsis sp. Hca4]QKV75285.1 hypothetical protein HUT10_17045 [Amycolatopsis sp. Hca4]
MGPAIVQAQDVPLPRRRPRTFRLPYDLARLSRASLSIGPDLGRVLGPAAERTWRRCGGLS